MRQQDPLRQALALLRDSVELLIADDYANDTIAKALLGLAAGRAVAYDLPRDHFVEMAGECFDAVTAKALSLNS